MGYWLKQVYEAIAEDFQKQLDHYGVTVAQWPVLCSLYSGTSKTPAEVATHVRVDRSAVTRLLDRLEAKGLVLRVNSTVDRRSVTLTLTRKGKQLVPKLAEISRKSNKKFMQGLSAAEQNHLTEILKNITTKIK